MATVIVLDNDGNERMRRDTDHPKIPPPPNFTANQWTAHLVLSLLEALDQEN